MPQHESSNWPPWGTDEPVKAPARTSSAPRADPRSFADSFGNDLQQRVNHYPAPDLARSQSLHAAGEPAARPRRGAGSSFYETSWKISFASDPSSDTLSDATETRTQFQPQPHVAEKRRQPPKTKSEVVLGALPSREFLASTTQVDFRDKSEYAETRELIVPSENKDTWKTTRRYVACARGLSFSHARFRALTRSCGRGHATHDHLFARASTPGAPTPAAVMR